MLIWADYKFIDSKAKLTPVQVVYLKALCVCVRVMRETRYMI